MWSSNGCHNTPSQLTQLDQEVSDGGTCSSLLRWKQASHCPTWWLRSCIAAKWPACSKLLCFLSPCRHRISILKNRGRDARHHLPVSLWARRMEKWKMLWRPSKDCSWKQRKTNETQYWRSSLGATSQVRDAAQNLRGRRTRTLLPTAVKLLQPKSDPKTTARSLAARKRLQC